MQNQLPELPPIPTKKKYFRIGEAAQLCGVRQDVLRYWEKEIPQLDPIRRGSQRRYRQQDVLMARTIRELRYGKGLTIEGVKAALLELKLKSADEAAEVNILDPNGSQGTLGTEDLEKIEKQIAALKQTLAILRNQ